VIFICSVKYHLGKARTVSSSKDEEIGCFFVLDDEGEDQRRNVEGTES
jgi:hypothetical protein